MKKFLSIVASIVIAVGAIIIMIVHESTLAGVVGYSACWVAIYNALK